MKTKTKQLKDLLKTAELLWLLIVDKVLEKLINRLDPPKNEPPPLDLDRIRKTTIPCPCGSKEGTLRVLTTNKENHTHRSMCSYCQQLFIVNDEFLRRFNKIFNE